MALIKTRRNKIIGRFSGGIILIELIIVELVIGTFLSRWHMQLYLNCGLSNAQIYIYRGAFSQWKNQECA